MTGEEHPDRGTVNDDADNVETAKEVGGRRRGRLVLRTVNEEDDFAVFHIDLVEHNTERRLGRKQENQAQSRRSESSSTETTSTVAVVIAGGLGDEHSDRDTTKLEADRIKGEGLHRRFTHLVAEAGSIVLHVSNNTNEVKKDGEDSGDGEEEGETAAAKGTEEISRRRGNPKTHRGEEKYTQSGKKKTERVEQMHHKLYQRQEKE